MKRLLFIIIGSVLVFGCAQPKEYSLSGTIKNATQGEIQIGIGEGNVQNAATVKLADDGTFTYTCSIEKPSFGFIYVPEQAFYSLICIGNTSTQLEADAANPTNYRYLGDLEAAYALYNQANRTMGELSEGDYASFEEMYTTMTSAQSSICKSLAAIPNRDFRRLQQKSIDEALHSNFIGYADRLRQKGLALDSDKGYNAFMEALKIKTSYDASIYITWKDEHDNAEPSYVNKLKIAKAKISDKELLSKVAFDLVAGYLYEPDEHIDEVYETARPLLLSDESVEWLDNTYSANKLTIPGAPAIDCDLEDAQGNTIKLSELYGKVLYLDIWATWCGPCCDEIPFMAQLAEHFASNPNILPISISVDAKQNEWLAQLKRDKPAWKQFRCQDFCTLYGISGIPSFIIIGADGKIVNAHAPRPSEEGCIAFLEEILNSK